MLLRKPVERAVAQLEDPTAPGVGLVPLLRRAMLGQPAADTRPPYFFTDQYDLGMEYTGYVGSGGYDQVVTRRHPEGLIVFWLRERRVLAGRNVNVWDVADHIERLVTSRRQVDLSHLLDPDWPLAELGKSASPHTSDPGVSD